MNINTKLTLLRTLEYYEGDLLSHFKDESNDKEYVWIWVDVIDKNETPWTILAVMTETNQNLVDQYMNKEISLRQLLSYNQDCYLITEKGDKKLKVECLSYLKLPSLYQAKENTVHDEGLRPENY